MADLRPKQRRFVDEYLGRWNATEAAKRAGYSEKTAYSIGPELLKKPEIANEIKRRLEESKLGADEVMSILREQATADVAYFIGDGGQILWDRVKEKGYLIKSIRHTRSGSTIELYDAQAALEKIGKHLGLWREIHELRGSESEPIQIEYVNDWREN